MKILDVEKLLRAGFSDAELEFLSQFKEFQEQRERVLTPADYEQLSLHALRLLDRPDAPDSASALWPRTTRMNDRSNPRE